MDKRKLDETIEALEYYIEENKDKLLVRVHVGTLIAALAFLKTLKPRIMNLYEVLNWSYLDDENREPIFVEWKSNEKGWYIHETYGIYTNTELGLCRCWTKKPTDEQIQEVKWE